MNEVCTGNFVSTTVAFAKVTLAQVVIELIDVVLDAFACLHFGNCR